MGNGASINVDDEDKAAESLIPLYREDPVKFARVLAKIKVSARSSRPMLPQIKVCEIAPIPSEELEAFKEQHISSTYLHDKEDPEFKERIKNSRSIQFSRWKWAVENITTYVNILRVGGHSDEMIQGMIDGKPMCFNTNEEFNELRTALAQLAVDLEKETGWDNIGFVFTGSCVPGFSQNPCKGFRNIPSKITNPKTSDVDICIVADGINYSVSEMRKQEQIEPKYAFPTTCGPTLSGMRFGCKDLNAMSTTVCQFHEVWSKKLKGGLQLTFCEDDIDTPPWETRVDITNL